MLKHNRFHWVQEHLGWDAQRYLNSIPELHDLDYYIGSHYEHDNLYMMDNTEKVISEEFGVTETQALIFTESCGYA